MRNILLLTTTFFTEAQAFYSGARAALEHMANPTGNDPMDVILVKDGADSPYFKVWLQEGRWVEFDGVAEPEFLPLDTNN